MSHRLVLHGLQNTATEGFVVVVVLGFFLVCFPAKQDTHIVCYLCADTQVKEVNCQTEKVKTLI